MGRWISVAPQGLPFFPPQALTEGGEKRKQVELTLYAENVTIWCVSQINVLPCTSGAQLHPASRLPPLTSRLAPPASERVQYSSVKLGP